jgi:hypothetical protein
MFVLKNNASYLFLITFMFYYNEKYQSDQKEGFGVYQWSDGRSYEG